MQQALILIAWVPVAACVSGDDGAGDESEEHPSSTAVVDDANRLADDRAPTFTEVYALIGESCGGGKSGCHVGGTSGGLEMPDADTAYEHLVGVASMKCPSDMRVVAGDADASQLVQALEGTSSCVKPMPLGRDPLSADAVATVRAWIDAGATPD
jgi:hypothetical protein